MKRSTEPTNLDPAEHDLLQSLERERRRVYDEIRRYPTPIPACDVQFNHLLERQAEIVRELDLLRAASQPHSASDST